MSVSQPCVLIFDSGVGALTIFDEIRTAYPGIECLVAMDNAGFPYGTKSESILLERISFILGNLCREFKPDLVVLACNTASTLALDSLRRQFSMPFVGVVPAIKPAAQLSNSRTIGLMATPATVNSDYTHQLIKDFAADCRWIQVGSAEPVFMAEAKLRGQAPDTRALAQLLRPFTEDRDMDVLVLACTHFPLLSEEIRTLLPDRVKLVDSGAAIARRVSNLLGAISPVTPAHRLIYSAEDPTTNALEAGVSQHYPFAHIEIRPL